MNFTYNNWCIPDYISRGVIDTLRGCSFSNTGETSPSVWAPNTMPQCLIPLWNAILDAKPDVNPLTRAAVFHFDNTRQRIENTVFPVSYGDTVAMVVLGAHAHVALPDMDTTLRVHNRSVLVMSNVENVHHSIAPMESGGVGERYIILFWKDA